MGDCVERIIISQKDKIRCKACHILCGLARRLGNCAAYHLRQRFFDGKGLPTRTELDTHLKEHYAKDYRAMPSAASAQRQGQVIAKDFKSFLKSSKDYKKHPDEYKGSVAHVSTVIRIAVMGRSQSPDVWTIQQILGEEKVRARISELIG